MLTFLLNCIFIYTKMTHFVISHYSTNNNTTDLAHMTPKHLRPAVRSSQVDHTCPNLSNENEWFFSSVSFFFRFYWSSIHYGLHLFAYLATGRKPHPTAPEHWRRQPKRSRRVIYVLRLAYTFLSITIKKTTTTKVERETTDKIFLIQYIHKHIFSQGNIISSSFLLNHADGYWIDWDFLVNEYGVFGGAQSISRNRTNIVASILRP